MFFVKFSNGTKCTQLHLVYMCVCVHILRDWPSEQLAEPCAHAYLVGPSSSSSSSLTSTSLLLPSLPPCGILVMNLWVLRARLVGLTSPRLLLLLLPNQFTSPWRGQFLFVSHHSSLAFSVVPPSSLSLSICAYIAFNAISCGRQLYASRCVCTWFLAIRFFLVFYQNMQFYLFVLSRSTWKTQVTNIFGNLKPWEPHRIPK